MDYENTQPPTEQENSSTPPPVTNDSAKARVKIAYIAISAILVLVAAGIVTWYFLSLPSSTAPQPAAVVKTVLPALTDGNTNTDIANDINKIPNDSATLIKDQNSITTGIQGL